MGTNCAVFIANLFCFTYEYAFISHLVSTQNISLLRKCMLVARLVDDIFVPYFPEFHSYRYTTDHDSQVQAGIYPTFLELTLEQSANSNVSFLDTTTFLDNECIIPRHMTNVNIHHYHASTRLSSLMPHHFFHLGLSLVSLHHN